MHFEFDSWYWPYQFDPFQVAGELEVIGKSVTSLQEEAEKAKEAAKQAKAEKKPLSAVEEEMSNV